MKFEIISVGSLKESYLIEAVEEYKKRLKKYATLKITEIKETKLPKHERKNDIEQALLEEAQMIQTKIKDAYVIALTIEGRQYSSEKFTKKLNDIFTYHNHHIVFIIGSSHGLHDSIKKQAHQQISFSEATFPHQLMRVILLEQLFRAMKIKHNEPYHK